MFAKMFHNSCKKLETKTGKKGLENLNSLNESNKDSVQEKKIEDREQALKNLSWKERELYLLGEIISKNANGRKIIIWGDDKELRNILKKYFNLEISFVITIIKEIINGKSIRNLEDMCGKSNEYYIIAFGREYELKYDKLLREYGYDEIKDFVYRKIKPIVLENWDTAKRYEDMYGNVIEGKGGVIKNVIFRGYNNQICIEENVSGLQNMKFDCCANHEIIIRKGCRFNGNTFLKLNGFQGYSKVFIDSGCRFDDVNLLLYGHPAGTQITIGEFCTFEKKLELHSNTGKKIVIGRDCMFSHDVHLQAGDGHSIFDTNTKQNVNSIYEKVSEIKNEIYLGEHVWVSANTFILNGTVIGQGSIIGAASTVKGMFPNNCVVAGNPAKLVKKDIAWSRENCATNIESCGNKEYIDKTKNSKPPISCKKVLVVGGTRFMGVQLVKELLANGNEVTIATRGKTKDNFGNRITRIILDISDIQSVKTALEGKYYDIVFDNLAYCSNYVRNLLSTVKCGKYIQLSSVEVYGPTKYDLKKKDYNPYTEKMEWCDQTVGYQKGKRQAEAAVYQSFLTTDSVTVRIPYVTKTDRLFYYCKHVVNQTPMNIDDINRGFTFIRDSEVGKFLVWIAAQEYTGPINLCSEGMVTIKEIIEYVEKKTKKEAIIDTKNGEESPFHAFNERTFSMNMDAARDIGYNTSKLEDWFWKLMDEYIERAIKEKQQSENELLGGAYNSTIACVNKDKCTGCGACVNICPKNAIVMGVDEEGFIYPRVEVDKCVKCGLCKEVCSTFEKHNKKKKNVACYAMIASDEVRMVSSSGGAFTLLAEEVLVQGGIVCGAAWNEKYSVEHILIDSAEDLYKLRGSKYVQSDTKFSFRKIKEHLEKGKKVLYTGMPCQIEGVLYYLGREYENLITVDILCRGIVSNELFKKFIEQNYKGLEISAIKFKDKKPLGWGATTSYEFGDGTVEKTNIHNSIWMCAYLANIMDRKSCYSCKFNCKERVGDISIGDFWGIEKYNATYNDSKGTSIVITSSKKGDELVQKVREQCKVLEYVPIEKGAPYNSALCQHVKWTSKRPEFFEVLRKMPFPAALDRTIYGEKYKVGIVGWWSNLNYGGTLTYYALNKVIQDMGYSVLMIRRSSSGPAMPNDNTIPMQFAKKHYNISRLYTSRDMHWINYSCHAFVSGSDQLWNPYLEEYSGPEFFLSFVNEHNIKISYASSFGNIEKVPEQFGQKYKPLLERFDGISVREDYAVDICKEEFNVDAVHVCDPVFLCKKQAYEVVADESKMELPDNYILNFLLDPNNEKVSAYRYAKEKLGIKNVVNFTDLQNTDSKDFDGDFVYKNANIEDFVKAYKNAKFIVTDSFHGTCFAIIFNKPFISIANYNRGEKRFISLLKYLNLSDRLVFDVNEMYEREDLFNSIDYCNVNKKIEEISMESYQWLQKMLSKMV